MKLDTIGAINDMPRGWKSSKVSNIKIYSMWYHMLDRCHCTPKDRNYRWYKDVTCDKDFYYLSNFVKWIEKEPRYQEFCETCESIRWCIDKDGLIKGNKEYTYDKIQLIPHSDNVKLLDFKAIAQTDGYKNKHKNHRPVIGINVNDNSIIEYRFLSECISDGFDPSNITKCCNGKRKSKIHKGYKWFYKNDYKGGDSK